MGERNVEQRALLESRKAGASLGRNVRWVKCLEGCTPLMEVVLLAWIGRVGEREEGCAQAPFCKKGPRSDLEH